jgi:hypothetical protein
MWRPEEGEEVSSIQVQEYMYTGVTCARVLIAYFSGLFSLLKMNYFFFWLLHASLLLRTDANSLMQNNLFMRQTRVNSNDATNNN